MGRKIVVNRCYGGFGLSEKCVLLYAKKKGLQIYVDHDARHRYWLTPRIYRTDILSSQEWYDATWEERDASIEKERMAVFNEYKIKRDDKFLIEAIGELGVELAGDDTTLEIVEIPEDIDWEIDDCSGHEKVYDKNRVW